MIQEVVPPFELEERAEAISQALANASTATIQQGMNFVARSRTLGDAATMDLALQSRAVTMAGLDFEEGVKAFKEKRPPRWPSHP